MYGVYNTLEESCFDLYKITGRKNTNYLVNNLAIYLLAPNPKPYTHILKFQSGQKGNRHYVVVVVVGVFSQMYSMRQDLFVVF